MLNWKSGFFRLWLVASAVWVVFAVATDFGQLTADKHTTVYPPVPPGKKYLTDE
jgi:hypothetical protein